MGINQSQNRKITQRPGNFFGDFTNRFRLIGRLIMDSRVSPLLKILPIGTLIYVVSPIDLLSMNPVDDAFVIWAGTTLFVELCPPQVVEEHMQLLTGMVSGQSKDVPGPEVQDDVIEGEYTETGSGGPKSP